MMKRRLPGIIAMATIVVLSNILVQFLLLDGFLTWGAFTFPFAFLVTDLINRFYGPKEARVVVYAGFATGVLCSVIGSQIMLEYGPAVPLRIAIASGVAFLTAQLVDIFVFDKMRNARWWQAPLASTLVGSVLDTALFFSLAFAASVPFYSEGANAAISWAWDPIAILGLGPQAPLWVSLALADWGVKLGVALLALIPFRWFSLRYLGIAR